MDRIKSGINAVKRTEHIENWQKRHFDPDIYSREENSRDENQKEKKKKLDRYKNKGIRKRMWNKTNHFNPALVYVTSRRLERRF